MAVKPQQLQSNTLKYLHAYRRKCLNYSPGEIKVIFLQILPVTPSLLQNLNTKPRITIHLGQKLTAASNVDHVYAKYYHICPQKKRKNGRKRKTYMLPVFLPVSINLITNVANLCKKGRKALLS